MARGDGALHLAPVPTAAGRLVEPAVPWLTADVLVGAVTRTSEQLRMLGDAERCIAWVLVEAGDTGA